MQKKPTNVLLLLPALLLMAPLTTFSQTPTQEWKLIAEGGKNALIQTAKSHFQAQKATGIGSFYGIKWEPRGMTLREYLDQNKRPGTSPALPQQTSCVGYVVNRILPAAYKNAGQVDRWNRIAGAARRAGAGGTDGIPLLKELKKDGWDIVFWITDSQNLSVVSSATNKDAGWYVARARKGYYESDLRVDGIIENFAPKNDPTKINHDALGALRNVPFWVSVGIGDMHCFAGRYGRFSEAEPSRLDAIPHVIIHESHWDRAPNDRTNLEEHDFARWAATSYCFGAMAIPKGYWKKPQGTPAIGSGARR